MSHPHYKSPALTIEKVNTTEQAESNCLFLNPEDYSKFLQMNNGQKPVYGQLNEFVFILESERAINQGAVGIPASIRNSLKLSPTMDKPIITWYELPKSIFMLGSVKFQVSAPTLKPEEKLEIKEEEFIQAVKDKFQRHFLGTGQELYIRMKVGANYLEFRFRT